MCMWLVHSLDSDWLLAQEWTYWYIYIYILACFSNIVGSVLSYSPFIFVCQLDKCWAGKCCFYCCLFSILEQWLLHFPSPTAMLYEGCALLWGLAFYVVITWMELEEFLMTGSMMIYSVASLLCSIAVHMSLPEDVGRLGRKSGALLVEVIVTGVEFGIGVGAALISHFLRKWWFLSMIFPDPSTLIWYWQSGKTVMSFPIVFHWWLSGLGMATVSAARNGYRITINSTHCPLTCWLQAGQYSTILVTSR